MLLVKIHHDLAAEETEIAQPFDQSTVLRTKPKIKKKPSRRLSMKLKKKKKETVSELVCYAGEHPTMSRRHHSNMAF